LEIKNSSDQIIRIGPNSQISLEETVNGETVICYGEVLIIGANPWKYQTSCWGGRAMPNQPLMVFIKPGEQTNTDEYYTIFGDLLIYEFDRNNRRYPISYVPANKKAIIKYSQDAEGPDKYQTSIGDISDKEYRYISDNYIIKSVWR